MRSLKQSKSALTKKSSYLRRNDRFRVTVTAFLPPLPFFSSSTGHVLATCRPILCFLTMQPLLSSSSVLPSFESRASIIASGCCTGLRPDRIPSELHPAAIVCRSRYRGMQSCPDRRPRTVLPARPPLSRSPLTDTAPPTSARWPVASIKQTIAWFDVHLILKIFKSLFLHANFSLNSKARPSLA